MARIVNRFSWLFLDEQPLLCRSSLASLFTTTAGGGRCENSSSSNRYECRDICVSESRSRDSRRCARNKCGGTSGHGGQSGSND